MLFSERIRTLRHEHGLLQRSLAQAIGVDVPMYSRYEHGERRPKREQVVKLARLLKTDANELVALWLAEEAVNAIGHDKMSARASQLLLETLDKRQHAEMPQAAPANADTAPDVAARTEDPTLHEAPAIDPARRTLVASLPPNIMPHYVEGDSRLVMQQIEDESVDCIVTTLPYWSLRRYGADKIEAKDLKSFIDDVLRVMAECRRVLKPEGSLWVGMADAYDNHSLQGVPWRLAVAMIDLQGWTLRNDVVLNTRQNSTDNTHTHLRNTHEMVFHFTKRPTDFFFNADELRRVFNIVTRQGSKGLMPADVWDIAMPKSPVERYVTAPEEVCRLAIVATCPEGGLVLDPYCGTGTTCKVAYDLNRRSVGIDINPERLRFAQTRVEQKSLSLF